MNLPPVIRVALVDDHSLVRDGIKALLSVMPRLDAVGEAENGAQAIEMVGRSQPDLLLMDISLKDMNGLELTRLLGKQYPSLKILILSMYDNYEYVSESVRSGASGYVLKNAPSREIIAAIEAIISGGTFYSAEIAQRLATDPNTDSELTPRESQVLAKMVQGLNNKEMARELDISVRTVETHRLSIRRKLNIDKPAALVKYAIDHGIISRWRNHCGEGACSIATGLFISIDVIIARQLKIIQQTRAAWRPAQQGAGVFAGHCHVRARHVGEPAEMLTLPGFHRQPQATTDRLGNVLERHSLVGDGVVDGLRHALLQRQPIDPCGVQPMHARPAVDAVPEIGRNARLPGQANQDRNESVVAEAMDRGCQAHGRAAHTTLDQRPGRRFGFTRRSRAGHLQLARAPSQAQQAGRHQQRSLDTLQRAAQYFDYMAVQLSVLGKPREVMIERGVNHRIRRRSRPVQDVEVIQCPADHLRAGRGQCGNLVIGTGQAGDLIAGTDQFLDHGRPNPARGTGNEYMHVSNS